MSWTAFRIILDNKVLSLSPIGLHPRSRAPFNHCRLRLELRLGRPTTVTYSWTLGKTWGKVLLNALFLGTALQSAPSSTRTFMILRFPLILVGRNAVAPWDYAANALTSAARPKIMFINLMSPDLATDCRFLGVPEPQYKAY
jgi:hypothetical protein